MQKSHVVYLQFSPNISETTLTCITLLNILYTVPHLVTVVGGCRNKLAECCSCRCLSQQKRGYGAMLIPSSSDRFISQRSVQPSVSSSCCGLTGWSLVLSVLICCHYWSSTLWLTASVFMHPYRVISTFSTVEYPWWSVTSCPLFKHECQEVMTISFLFLDGLWRAIFSHSWTLMQSLGKNGVNTKICWWHTCVDMELLKTIEFN